MGMTIGEIATRVGVPTATIRYYEGRGLIPEAPRTRSGYRQYGDEAAERLRFIRRAQEFVDGRGARARPLDLPDLVRVARLTWRRS